MRFIATTALLGLAATVVAGCDGPTPPATPDIGPRAGAARPLGGASITSAAPIRARLDVTAWTDLRTVIPASLVTPAAAQNIGPGSAIIITIPDEGSFGCTANFVWRSPGQRYLGAAGHCFLPGDKAATHGPGADYDASGVAVEVCVDGCEGNFDTDQLVGTWVTLGRVAYARQTLDGEDVGNDFGIIEIPREFRDLVRLTLPVWGGPTGVETLEFGEYGCHYGNGLGTGEVFLTKARLGIGGGSDADSWMGDFTGTFGDSGSGMVGCVNDGLLSFRGTGAIGILTHLGVSVDETTGAHGVTFGTTIARAIAMAREAQLKLSIVLP